MDAPPRAADPDVSFRRWTVAAVAATSVAAAAGCSSESTTSTAAGAIATTLSAAPPTSLVVEDSAATTQPPAAPDPDQLLAGAFAAVQSGYHFVTTATVDGQELVSAEGDRVDQRTRVSVSSDGATVDYVIAPEGAWASVDGGWQQLEQPPITDPLAALQAPQSLSVVTVEGDVVTLAATYPPSALSLTGDDPVTVTFVIDGTQLRSMSYVTTTADGDAEVDAAITPLVDSVTVELPTA